MFLLIDPNTFKNLIGLPANEFYLRFVLMMLKTFASTHVLKYFYLQCTNGQICGWSQYENFWNFLSVGYRIVEFILSLCFTSIFAVNCV